MVTQDIDFKTDKQIDYFWLTDSARLLVKALADSS